MRLLGEVGEEVISTLLYRSALQWIQERRETTQAEERLLIAMLAAVWHKTIEQVAHDLLYEHAESAARDKQAADKGGG